MRNKKEAFFLLFLFLFALGLRLSYFSFLKQHYFFVNYPSDDVQFYQSWAEEIASGHWLGNHVFYGMPLYAYFLAIIKRLTGNHPFLIHLVQFFLGSFNCILLYQIAKKIFSPKVAIIAGILSATNFVLIYYDWLLMPVTLLITLSLIIANAVLSFTPATSKREWFLLGSLLGLCVLGDGKFIFVAIFAAAFFLRQNRGVKQNIASALFVLFAGVAVILSLVALRNRMVDGDWVFLSAHGGINFYLGNNPQATGTFENPDFLRPTHEGHIDDPRIIAETTLNRSLKPSEVSQFWSNKAWAFIKNSPARTLLLLGKKCLLFFTDAETAYDIDLILQKDWKGRVDVNSFRIICPLAILGIGISFISRNFRAIVPFSFVLSQLIFTMLFFLITRHRATVLPFFILFESLALSWLFEKIKSRRIKEVFFALLAFFLLFALLKSERYDTSVLDFLRATKSGLVFADEKKFAEARIEYQKALGLQPRDTNTIYNLANSFAAENNFAEAILWYQRAVSMNPLNVDVLYNLGYSHEQMGNTKDAIAAYGKVVNLMPKSYDAHIRLANIFIEKGRCQDAKKHFQTVLAHYPQLSAEITSRFAACKKKLP